MTSTAFSCRPAHAWLAALVCLLVLPPRTSLGAIEEIIVTTRRKEENLQQVPISVTAITDEQIQRQGITNLEEITRLSSSVQFDTAFGPQDTRVTIRGLSNTRGRSNVAFLVDGIDVTTENLVTSGSGLLANRRLLNDIQQIEVVKGPQSALYGRAAFAGAISYTTKEPGQEWTGNVGLDFADYGKREGNFAVGGPIWEDKLGIRLNGLYWSQDGFYRNSVSGNFVGGGEGYGTSLVLVFKPFDSVKIKGRLEYSQDNDRPLPEVRINQGVTLPYINQVTRADPLGCLANFTNDPNQPHVSLPLGAYYTLPVSGGLPVLLGANGAAANCVVNSLTSYNNSFKPSGSPAWLSAGPNSFVGLYDVNPNNLPFPVPQTYGSAAGKQVSQSEN